MGYRSDVALELSKEKSDLFQALYAAKFPEDVSWLYNNVENENEYGTLYIWTGTKWYDSFPEVSFIQHFIDNIDHGDYAFVRVGEESDDNEHHGDGDLFGLYINRSIGCYR